MSTEKYIFHTGRSDPFVLNNEFLILNGPDFFLTDFILRDDNKWSFEWQRLLLVVGKGREMKQPERKIQKFDFDNKLQLLQHLKQEKEDEGVKILATFLPSNLKLVRLGKKMYFEKWANPGLFLFIFVLFKHKVYRKNC